MFAKVTIKSQPYCFFWDTTTACKNYRRVLPLTCGAML